MAVEAKMFAASRRSANSFLVKCDQRALIFLLACLVIIVPFYTNLPSRHAFRISLETTGSLGPTHRISCIGMAKNSSTEGLGAIIKRHEFAIALAEVYDARVQFVDKESGHGYVISDFFDKCPGEPDCFLKQTSVIVDRCVPGDCTCMSKNFLSATENLGDCRLLQVKVDEGRHMQYGGCYNKTLERYFPAKKRLVAGPYAALHYRQGDLKRRPGGKAFGPVELAAFVYFLCRATDLRIILVTQGSPEFPTCRGRIWMANDTTMAETFNIFKYADTIVVGTSSFARLIAQGTHAKRFVVPMRGVGLYLWATGVRWTVVGADASLHHYSSTEDMMRASSQPRGFRMQSYRLDSQNKPVPLRFVERSWRKRMQRVG